MITFTGCNENAQHTSKAGNETNNTLIKQNQQDTLIQPVQNDLAQVLNPSQEKKIIAICGKKDGDSLIAFLNSYPLITTSDGFLNQWLRGSKLLIEISAHLNKKYGEDGYSVYNKLNFLEKTFALRSSCDAECTVFIFTYNAEELLKLAKKTTGTEDEQFVQMLQAIQGENLFYSKSWLTSFDRTWDYGGGSTLGDSVAYNYLKASYEYMKTHSSYNKTLKANREHVINDMAHPIYMQTKDNVKRELNRILQAHILSVSETKKVEQILNRIFTEDPELQFNCADGDINCDFGG